MGEKLKNNIVSLNDYLNEYYTEPRISVDKLTYLILEGCKTLENTIPNEKELSESLKQIDNNLLALIFNTAEQIGYDDF